MAITTLLLIAEPMLYNERCDARSMIYGEGAAAVAMVGSGKQVLLL